MFKLSTKSKFLIASFLSKIFTFFLGDKKRIIKRNNIRYEVDLKEGIDLGIFFGVKNEKNLYKIGSLINSNKWKILVDIGANVGSVTLPLAKLFKKSTIISIEPTNYAFAKLKKNLSLNTNLKDRVKLHKVFISNKKKKINLVHSSWNFHNNSNKHKVHLGTLKKTTVKSISLNKILKKIKKIDFIKIDVDGYELDVLKSGAKIISKSKPLIFFEFAPYLYKEFGYSPKTLIDYIKNKMNYVFVDENFVKVQNIEEVGNQLNNRSENFFLIHEKKIDQLKEYKNEF